MTTITLKPLLHKGCENIAILMPNEAELNLSIRKCINPLFLGQFFKGS